MKTMIAAGVYNRAKTRALYNDLENAIENIRKANAKKTINFLSEFAQKIELKENSILLTPKEARNEALRSFWMFYKENMLDDMNNLKPAIKEIFEEAMGK